MAASLPRVVPVLLLQLSVAAGAVDAVCFLALGEVLTAAMTGNTVLLGIALGQAEYPAALGSGLALAGFFSGALLGALLTRSARASEPWPRTVTSTLLIEWVLLLALLAVWHQTGSSADGSASMPHPLILLAGLAMGLQSAAIARLHGVGESTTYFTGTLVRIASGVATLGSAHDRVEGSPEGRPHLSALIWLAYGVGSALAAGASVWWPQTDWMPTLQLNVAWPEIALVLPVLLLPIVILTASIHFHVWGPPTRGR